MTLVWFGNKPSLQAEYAASSLTTKLRITLKLGMTQKPCIFHIANLKDIDTENSNADYQCDSLTSEGFIHCCDRHQLLGVVTRYYEEIDDVVLLVLDVEDLEPALIHENTMGGAELFPHVYGAINRSAILEIIPFGINSTERQGLFL